MLINQDNLDNDNDSVIGCSKDVERKAGLDVPARRIPEILAPAGGRKQFLAALGAGADAVYLGMKQFNARARAENFSFDDLAELVPLAKTFGMEVLVAINILIKESELKDLIPSLVKLERIGVDAVIVQDLGIAKLIRDYFPGLRMHASTQLAVHNASGVAVAKEKGFKRVVLAREMTATELRRIRSRFPKHEIELEAFCHGSLCYSYSGLCFFSGAQDGRSGNRGECAYTCREPYRILSEAGHGFLFSMKDLDTTNELTKLVDAGIDTLKIEGRKKDAQFVATVVRNYRQQLNQIFGRSTLRESAPKSALEWLDVSPAISWEEMAYSYHRERTSLFIASRYHENVIDLANPTHKGVEVGEIKSVSHGHIVVATKVPLARFDGLKIVAKGENFFHAQPQHAEKLSMSAFSGSVGRYRNDELQFSIREMRVAGRLASEVPAGSEVEITVEAEPRQLRRGDLLYKTRSSLLKNKVEGLTSVPEGYRLHQYQKFDLSIAISALDEGEIGLRFQGEVLGREFYVGNFRLPLQLARHSGGLDAAVRKQFSVFGDQNLEAMTLTIDADGDYFLPPSQLRAIKRDLGEALHSALDADESRRIAEVLEGTLAANSSALGSVEGDNNEAKPEGISWSLKFDRMEVLEWVQELWSEGKLPGLSEIVFEPKRSALNDSDNNPQFALASLQSFVRDKGIKLRLSIPTVVRAWDEPFLRRWVAAYSEIGEGHFEVGNVGHRILLKDFGITNILSLSSDFSLYAMNSMAAKELIDDGFSMAALSIEDDRESLTHLLECWPQSQLAPQVILYKDTPLFIAESCSLTALHNGCPTAKVCGYRSLEIENSKGEKFVVAHESCKSIVYAEVPYGIAQCRRQLEEMGVRNFRLDFLTRPYKREQFRSVVLGAWSGSAIPKTHSANFSGQLL